MDDLERIARALPLLPIFPLPGAVLLPHGLVPLHIFEPRYRKMTRDCNAGLRVMALGNLPDNNSMLFDPPRMLPVIGVGILARVDNLPDGRFNIVLRGTLRARIKRELPCGEPYRLVDAEELAPDPAERTHPSVIREAHALQQMIMLLSQRKRTKELTALAQLVARATDPGDVADIVAGALMADPRDRQAVLEAVEIRERLELASQSAAQALAQSTPVAATIN